MRPRLAILCTGRPSWSKLSPVVDALRKDASFDVDLIGAAHALTHSTGIVDPAFQPTTRLDTALETHSGTTSATVTGLLTLQLAQHFAQTKPAAVMVCADRFETLAGTIAASYQNIPVVHLQGGERSGNIDDRVRYANTALASWHCVSNRSAYANVVNAGAHLDRVLITGCSSCDVARLALTDPPVTKAELDHYGTGDDVDPEQPFALVLQHPVTDHPETAVAEMREALRIAAHQPRIIFWPGADSGTDSVSKYLRSVPLLRTRFIRSLPPRRYLKLLSQASLGVGNSSSLIREGSFIGVKKIILGDRQRGRAYTQEASHLYGDGYASERIVEVCRRAVDYA